MKILGLEYDLWMYSLSGIIIGLGFGIVLSNKVRINAIWGFILMIIAIFLSGYFWNKGIRKYFIKN